MGEAESYKQTSPFELARREVPRELRAREGSEQITAWCPTCKENAVPMRNGTCAFCDTVIVGPTLNGNGHAPADPQEGTLRLGDDLLLPLDAATQSLAILAVKGAGKSNAAAVLAEELFDEGIPWVVIDPKGDWWGIRETVGESRGLPVPVLGGDHGDLPLSPWSGAAVAGLIVERNLTCVLDVSAMDDEERPGFLHALGLALFELHRRSPSVRHIILEEAHEVVPQGGGKEMRPTLKAWTRIVCQGRQRGLGITLVSQRSALVAKNVLTQTGSLIVLRTTSPQDRAVIRGWVDFHSVSKELVDSLPALADGEAWIIAPSWLGRVERVRLRRRWTFDSGATPEVISTRRTRTLDSTDIEQIGRLLSPAPPEEEPEPARADEIEDAETIILGLLADAPRKAGELGKATGLSRSRLLRLLHGLADAGQVRKEGEFGGAVWLRAGEDEPQPPVPPERMGAAPAGQLVHSHSDAEHSLARLDELLDEARYSLTLLRARYLAALLARIEAGAVHDGLLDRFERIAGLSTANPSPGEPLT